MIDPKLIDIDFKFDGLSGDILEQDLLYAGAKSFPDKFLVDRSEWDDRIRENDKHKSSADYFSGRFTHQSNSHECVCHAAHQSL